MPYIQEQDRLAVKRMGPADGGELCYAITVICKKYLEREGEKYDHYGEIRHALATTWDEYFLPKFREYEAKRKKENGDV